jgi:hypothetical protein
MNPFEKPGIQSIIHDWNMANDNIPISSHLATTAVNITPFTPKEYGAEYKRLCKTKIDKIINDLMKFSNRKLSKIAIKLYWFENIDIFIKRIKFWLKYLGLNIDGIPDEKFNVFSPTEFRVRFYLCRNLRHELLNIKFPENLQAFDAYMKDEMDDKIYIAIIMSTIDPGCDIYMLQKIDELGLGKRKKTYRKRKSYRKRKTYKGSRRYKK